MKKPVIQAHHITYEPERTVNVYKGEHLILTQLQWRKNISKGFLEALDQWLLDNRIKAVELNRPIVMSKNEKRKGARRAQK